MNKSKTYFTCSSCGANSNVIANTNENLDCPVCGGKGTLHVHIETPNIQFSVRRVTIRELIKLTTRPLEQSETADYSLRTN